MVCWRRCRCRFVNEPMPRSLRTGWNTADITVDRSRSVIEPEPAGLAGFIGLPAKTGVHVQTGEPTSATCRGVDANRMTNCQWYSTSLRCMAANHRPTRFMRCRITKRLPVQHEIGLFIDWDVRICICVHEEYCQACSVMEHHLAVVLLLRSHRVRQRRFDHLRTLHSSASTTHHYSAGRAGA